MTRPRVAFVLGSAAGGTATHVAMLAGGCRRSGLDVCAFGPRATRELFPESAGIVFRPVEISARPRPVHDAIAVTRLRGLLGRLRPGVVHAHGLRAGAIAALALLPASARGLAPPLVVTVHNAAPGGRLPGLIYRLLEAVVARRSAMVLCASRDLAVRMRALGARKADLAVVPARRRPAAEPAAVARARAGIAADEPVVLASGRAGQAEGDRCPADRAQLLAGLPAAPRCWWSREKVRCAAFWPGRRTPRLCRCGSSASETTSRCCWPWRTLWRCRADGKASR